MSHRHKMPAECESIGPIGCRNCDLHDICRLAGVLAFDAGRSRQSTGRLRTIRPGEHLFRAGGAAHAVYAVRQGLLKTVRVSADGEEEILALSVPGELLGLEAFGTGVYASDVVGAQHAVCCELPLHVLANRGNGAGQIDAALVRLLSRATLPRPIASRGAVRRRITRFLLDLGARLAERGLDGQEFTLGLSRGEIANLLDTRLETVSRTLQQLHRERVIEVRGSRVMLGALEARHAQENA